MLHRLRWGFILSVCVCPRVPGSFGFPTAPIGCRGRCGSLISADQAADGAGLARAGAVLRGCGRGVAVVEAHLTRDYNYTLGESVL